MLIVRLEKANPSHPLYGQPGRKKYFFYDFPVYSCKWHIKLNHASTNWYYIRTNKFVLKVKTSWKWHNMVELCNCWAKVISCQLQNKAKTYWLLLYIFLFFSLDFFFIFFPFHNCNFCFNICHYMLFLGPQGPLISSIMGYPLSFPC